jgi:hypothetical protein
MPPNNQMPPNLNQLNQQQPLQTQQPQFGNIGQQGGQQQQGGGNNQPPEDPRNWLRKIYDYLSRQRGILDLPKTWNDTGPVSTSEGQTGQFAWGNPGGWDQLPNYTDEQNQGYNQVFQNGLQMLNDPYKVWQGQEDYAHQQFNERILPNILERINAGSGARLSSPSLSHQISQGGSGLASMLQASRENYGQNNREFGLRQIESGGRSPWTYASRPPEPGFVEKYGPTIVQGALMHYTGGQTGAPAVANLIKQGVNAYKGKK